MNRKRIGNLIKLLISSVIFPFTNSLSAAPADSSSLNIHQDLSLSEKAKINFEDLLDYQVRIDSIIKFENVSYNTLPGVAPQRLMFDLYVKDNYQTDSAKKPLLFFVHGGTWRSGDKEFPIEKVKKILERGFIFASTNYRLSPEPVNIDDSTRIKFPVHLQDVARSFAKIYEILPFLNGDQSKIAVIGHSAGGNLALSLATMDGYLSKFKIPLSSIKSAINLDGVALNIDSLIKSLNGSYKKEFMNAFGNTSEEWKKASPALNFSKSKDVANILLICQNQNFRSKFSYDFAERLEKAKINSAVYLAYDFDHNEILMNFCSEESELTKIYTNNIFNFIEESFRKR